MSTSAFPILTALDPRAGRSARSLVALIAEAPARARQARRPAVVASAPAALSDLAAAPRSTPATPGFQFVSKHTWIERVGHLLAPRRRRHLAVPRRAHRGAVPAGDRRRRPAPRREAVPRLAAAARGRRDGQLPQPRPVRLLHLLRDRARADVLPHRRVGLRATASTRRTKFFLFTMFGSAFMLVGIIATVVPRPRDGVGHTHVRPRRASPSRPTSPTSTGALAVLRLRHRVRRQGADLPVAHVAARRPHPGADRRLGDPRRRDAEARHVRPPALRPVPVPRGGASGRGRCCSRSP